MQSQSGRLISMKGRWIYFLAVLLVLYLAAHIARAQEASPSQEPTLNPTATEAVTVGIDVSPTLTSSELTAFPTDAPTSTLVVTEEAAVEQTSEADVSATAIAPQPTDIPTDTPIATVVATAEVTDASASASITIAANLSLLSDNRLLTLTVSAEGLSDVYHVAVACRVDPTVLQGVQATTGDMLLPDLSTVTDTGFQPDGLWILFSNQADLAPALVSTGTLWTITYQVVGTSATAINCQVEIGDANKQPISLTNPNASLTIDGFQSVITEPTSTPAVIETEVPIIVEATAEITEIPTEVPVTSTPIDRFHISGGVESAIPLNQATVTISGSTFNQVIALQENGTYSADIPAGEYQFVFNARYCLPLTMTITITDKPLRLPTANLPGGDVDENMIIDMADAILVSQSFGLTPPLTAAADLNGDGVVNIYDLALVSANIHS